MCDLKYDDALSILDTINDYEHIEFDPRNDQKEILHSLDYDPIEPLFIVDFEKAKCYMGKKEYAIALNKYLSAQKIVNKLLDNDGEKEIYKKLKTEIYKNLATNLVMQNNSNLSLALGFLSELNEHESIRPNEAALYMIAERWDDAILILRDIKDNDYAYSLLARCYMELSKKGNKEMYLDLSIKVSEEAMDHLKTKGEKDKYKEYVQRTNKHDHYYKLAIANQELGHIENAVNNYKELANGVYENEDAMHDLAYIQYQNIDYFEKKKRESKKKHQANNESQEDEKTESNDRMEVYKVILKDFFNAIERSRVEKNPKNFNDLGRMLISISSDKNIGDTKALLALIEERVNNLPKENGVYPNSVRTEMKIIVDYVLKSHSDTDNQKLLLIAKHFFKIADLINRKDAFANKNLGDIYYNVYLKSNERVRHENAEKALKRYILANSYYLIDGKRCSEIEERIKELEGFLKRIIVEVNE